MSEYFQALPPGFRFDEYEIERVLGTGGFGITYLGLDHNLGHKVAIKEYLPGDLAIRVSTTTGASDETMVSSGPSSVLPKSPKDKTTFEWGLERFLDEARTLALFNHPNLIRVHRFFRAHGTACIVMEYAEGDSLATRLSGGGTIPEAELRQILFPILDGLEVVHEAGYLHRDIKPGNIILRPDGSPVLLDFGAARQAVGNKTQTMTSVLSPGYAPIEQYADKSKQGPWTDLYSLGAMCYRCIVGKVPDPATSRVYDDPMVGWTKEVEGYDPVFLRAIEAAMRPKDSERPQSIAHWRRQLSQSDTMAATRLAGAAPAPTAWKPAAVIKHPKKPDAEKDKQPGAAKTWLLGIAGAAAAVGVGVAGYLYWQSAVERAGADETAWLAASSAGTVAALEAYAGDHPGGQYVADAEARIAALQGRAAEQTAWARALERDTVEDYQDYLADHGAGQHAAEAGQGLARLRDAAAQVQAETETVDQGDQDAWTRAANRNSIDAYEEYLAAYPEGVSATQARTRIDDMMRRARTAADAERQRQDAIAAENRAWRDARSADTLAAYQTFLERFPDSASAQSARVRVGALRRAEQDRLTAQNIGLITQIKADLVFFGFAAAEFEDDPDTPIPPGSLNPATADAINQILFIGTGTAPGLTPRLAEDIAVIRRQRAAIYDRAGAAEGVISDYHGVYRRRCAKPSRGQGGTLGGNNRMSALIIWSEDQTILIENAERNALGSHSIDATGGSFEVTVPGETSWDDFVQLNDQFGGDATAVTENLDRLEAERTGSTPIQLYDLRDAAGATAEFAVGPGVALWNGILYRRCQAL